MARRNVPESINSNALMNKAKSYIRRALRDRDQHDPTGYQFWASLSLELLGKFALSSIHPSLIVDVRKSDDALAACGFSEDHNSVRTITAEEAYLRLSKIEPKFDKEVKTFCGEICNRRNAELHSGASPFVGMSANQWEGIYWKSVEAILAAVSISIEVWLDEFGEGKEEVISNYHSAEVIDELAKQDFRDHIKEYEGLSRAEKDRMRKAASAKIEPDRNTSFDGQWNYGNLDTDKVACPCCNFTAEIEGSRIGSHVEGEEFEGGDLYEEVCETYRTDFFSCLCCNLSITNHEAILEAGIQEFFKNRSRRIKQSCDSFEELEIAGETHSGFSISYVRTD